MAMKYHTTAEWDEALWLKAEQVYAEAFPEHGRKNRSLIQRMFKREICNLHTWSEGTDVVAMALTAINRNAKVLIIDYIAVRQNQRGKGLGRKCIEDIRAWAESTADCRGIVIEVEAEPTKENAERIRFWEKVGFHLTDYVHPYIWVPETYRAMYLSFNEDFAPLDDGKTLFSYITDYHEKAYRGK
ncbi:GNAT family N-acetyltransferase [Paenibacillus radicis (ex Xue et al. 2023)]|uniref:GNAT family N-acetyltransferase n=1 Tax=Paenibacillus radicis (ex Xue et al. 2023) TaxID=2972489 RepID=A0ABT1YT63_9BACL|nr:GNAT family N-acetyltransferase [Paenibacillus radicis (ex Xue et al. 2023)]MCR8635175.1 GNAT family N-acetyltransferase [Paenibacillus radicis (ex Xue et al. 2023)]